MTGISVKDPLAESYITVVHRLLDELTKNAEKAERIAELEAEIAKRDQYQSVAASVVAEGFTAEVLEAEAAAYELPVWPVPFPNRFPIWDKWSDVPDSVTYESIEESVPTQWINRCGVRYVFNADWWESGNPPCVRSTRSNEMMQAVAPFVEVK